MGVSPLPRSTPRSPAPRAARPTAAPQSVFTAEAPARLDPSLLHKGPQPTGPHIEWDNTPSTRPHSELPGPAHLQPRPHRPVWLRPPFQAPPRGSHLVHLHIFLVILGQLQVRVVSRRLELVAGEHEEGQRGALHQELGDGAGRSVEWGSEEHTPLPAPGLPSRAHLVQPLPLEGHGHSQQDGDDAREIDVADDLRGGREGGAHGETGRWADRALGRWGTWGCWLSSPPRAP